MTTMQPTAGLRSGDRAPDTLRPVTMLPDFAPAAAGSVLIGMGRTRLLCAVSAENGIPPWMRRQNKTGGWLTAEYSLLPYATGPRTSREISTGRREGRSFEIQRLIGRVLRAITDLEALGTRTLWVDCDVLEADGGTRTAAVTGAYTALAMAIERLLATRQLEKNPLRDSVAAVSVGLVDGVPLLDLDYGEDSRATVDLNVAMTASGKLVDIQGAAEGNPFTTGELQAMVRLARKGIRDLSSVQQQCLAAWRKRA